ncbi:hypothetical protein [Massilia sp.]|uniref:hypothetical protein n=1 Tax=Massilia sp. TaxID=1882437 RepID=UPI0028A5E5F3|nr:hypothetical protein [Massilia sp.]
MFKRTNPASTAAFTSAFTVAFLLAGLAGCGTAPLTVDDGRPLDSRLIANMRDFSEAAISFRPAIVRSAAAAGSGCASEYELPFDAMSTYGLDDDSRVAWVRALGLDENLTVIAADPSSGLRAGDVLAKVDGYKSGNKLRMADRLVEARDRGEPFSLKLGSGEEVTVSPFRLCRGRVLVAPPLDPALQRYHWSESVHPLEVFHQPLSADEAEWIVLWTQGLSEEGGARMKSYAFMVGSFKWLSVLGLGFATSSAVATARAGAAAAGTSATGQIAAAELAGQAASLMAQSAANRASLTGVSHVAAGVFDRADKWAFENMRRLGMNPAAGLSLHRKLVARAAASNAFLLDEKRLRAMQALVAGMPGGRAQPRGR